MTGMRVGRAEAVRAAVLTALAPGPGSGAVGAVVEPLFGRAAAALQAAGAPVTGPTIATCEPSGAGLLVRAGFVLGSGTAEVPGLETLDLPETDAAVALHPGDPAGLDAAWGRLLSEVAAAGPTPVPPAREVYRTPPDRPRSDWRTELVQPVAPA